MFQFFFIMVIIGLRTKSLWQHKKLDRLKYYFPIFIEVDFFPINRRRFCLCNLMAASLQWESKYKCNPTIFLLEIELIKTVLCNLFLEYAARTLWLFFFSPTRFCGSRAILSGPAGGVVRLLWFMKDQQYTAELNSIYWSEIVTVAQLHCLKVGKCKRYKAKLSKDDGIWMFCNKLIH